MGKTGVIRDCQVAAAANTGNSSRASGISQKLNRNDTLETVRSKSFKMTFDRLSV
jgi:hypothetical protein